MKHSGFYTACCFAPFDLYLEKTVNWNRWIS